MAGLELVRLSGTRRAAKFIVISCPKRIDRCPSPGLSGGAGRRFIAGRSVAAPSDPCVMLVTGCRRQAPRPPLARTPLGKNFGGTPPSADAWRAPGAETKRPHGATWLHDGSRERNRQTTRTRPYNSELKRTGRSSIK